MPYCRACRRARAGRTPIGRRVAGGVAGVVPLCSAVMPTADTKIRARLEAATAKSPLLGRPGFLIRRLHQLHCALFLEETRDFGITPVQYSLMTALAERGELDQNGLALEIGLERTSVAEVLPRLQERGILVRHRSVADGRVKLVKLTRKGLNLLRQMGPAVERAHDRTVAHLDPAERGVFVVQLIRLVESHNDIAAAPLRLR